jgi:hypothetical protein
MVIDIEAPLSGGKDSIRKAKDRLHFIIKLTVPFAYLLSF